MVEKQRIINQGGRKSSLFICISDPYNEVGELRTLGKTGWYGQVRSQAASLDFMVKLENVICHGKDGPFGVYLDAPSEKETPEIHVLFRHSDTGKEFFYG